MIFIILPIALALGAIAVVAFILAVRRGQFDDLDTPPMRIVFDDEAHPRAGGSQRRDRPHEPQGQ